MNDAAVKLQQKIRGNIPLSGNMQFEIRELDQHGIVVDAPLAPNINIHGTGFAGSIYSLAVLTGWALCTHLLESAGIVAELVVASAEIKYRSAVTGDIECRCSVEADRHETFVRDCREKNRGRMVLEIVVGEDRNAVLTASYVALA